MNDPEKRKSNVMAPKKTTDKTDARDESKTSSASAPHTSFSEAGDDDEDSDSTTVFDDDFEDMELPEDSSLITGDVEGYWDPSKTAIRCKPISVKLFDGNIDPKRPAMLVIAELTVPCKIAYKAEANDEEWSYRKAKTGTMVGIWYKAGMRGIVNKAGVDCYVKLTDKTKDTGKPNEMKIYEVRAGAGGMRIPITEDVRHKSQGVTTDFDVRRTPAGKKKEEKDDDYDDDFPE